MSGVAVPRRLSEGAQWCMFRGGAGRADVSPRRKQVQYREKQQTDAALATLDTRGHESGQEQGLPLVARALLHGPLSMVQTSNGTLSWHWQTVAGS